MKRLVFCFDGTTNELGDQNPTNVVRVAQSITPVTEDDIVQIIHYDEGVGTVGGERVSGGMFGKGLFYNVIEAYNFLVFNYSLHDEIYVFGFSRGAFTARVFVGLIQNCGILPRVSADQISDVERQYRSRSRNSNYTSDEFRNFRARKCPQVCLDDDEDDWRVRTIPGYAKGSGQRIRIKYLGVWDTVRSIGLFDNTFLERTFGFGDGRYSFYDHSLSSTVVSARHAMAADEQREKFNALQWTNVDELNSACGFKPDDSSRPYQQVWFPGTHGGVGGGGEFKGLSDGALDWVLDGARRQGLRIDNDVNSPLFDLAPDPFDHLDNVDKYKPRKLSSLIMDRLPSRIRSPGPKALHEISESAIARWHADPALLAERVPYRPRTFLQVTELLNGARNRIPSDLERAGEQEGADGTKFVLYTVKVGDTLTKIAQKFYGDASRNQEIAEFNYPKIPNVNKVYAGVEIRIPNPVKVEQ